MHLADCGEHSRLVEVAFFVSNGSLGRVLLSSGVISLTMPCHQFGPSAGDSDARLTASGPEMPSLPARASMRDQNPL
jgi:hypothetical protein